MTSRFWLKQMAGYVLAGAIFLLLGAQAYALTPAGTEIRNQSVATYKDANQQNQISTSNEVL
jgi:23S rRNA A1618 N6-methylase RlmF